MLSARKLLETVNSVDTLSQEELFPLFSRASFLVRDCVRLLARENSYIQHRIISLGAEVATNMDRNKAIYRRSMAYEDGKSKDVKPDAEKRETDFLCSCMELQKSLATDDTEKQLSIVLSLPLTRRVLEHFVKSWLSSTEDYQETCFASAEARLTDDIVSVSAFDAQCLVLEDAKGLDARAGYGVVRYIQNRISSLDSIYERIFNAYSRVVLKLAKSQAVSEDNSLDNFQNGSMGLMRSISSYDEASNVRFVGHARWWVRQSMLYHIKEDSNLIRVSSNTWQHFAKLEAIKSDRESKGMTTDMGSLSLASGYSKTHVQSVYNMIRTSQVRSLDYPLTSDGSSTMMSFVDLQESSDSLDYSPSDSVKVLLENLPDNYRNIVCLAFGLTEYIVQDLDLEKVEIERKRQSRKL